MMKSSGNNGRAKTAEHLSGTDAEEGHNNLVSRYHEMANDADRESEAVEWGEGLIVDASTTR